MTARLAPAILLALLPLVAHAANDSSALLARLQNAQSQTSLDDPILKPWHLKLAIQLFDDAGKPTGEGTIEEWWASPTRNKVVYTTPAYQASVLHNASGSFHSKDASPTPPTLALLLSQVVHPMPSQDQIHLSTPDLRTQSFGTVPLDCIMLNGPIASDAHPPLGTFPTYCLSKDSAALRVSFKHGNEFVVRNIIGSFQGRSIATDISIQTGDIVHATAKIASLESIPAEAPVFTSTEGMEPTQAVRPHLAGNVLAGFKTGGAKPVYPQDAMQRRISGSVVLQALVGRDGHIQNLTLISSPDASLTQAAIAAVRTWTYKPYLFNGQPVEIDASITVNFAMNFTQPRSVQGGPPSFPR